MFLFWRSLGILMALAPIPFLMLALYAFLKDQKAEAFKRGVAVPGLLLAIYCAIPEICFAIDGLVRKHYWNRPIVSPTPVDRLFLAMTSMEFMCFIFVPIAAILSIVLLIPVRGRTLRYGAISVCLARVMLWVSGF